ncbi:IgGFc-binding protein-like [Erythrolamprus reginae]|uniref:IgGFc-binding protein-like n=1 Tax=Erythrolamprus reginae TaxID=121349 RepID=UPI00396C5C00
MALRRLLFLLAGLAQICGTCRVSTRGKSFVTAFMQNHNPGPPHPKLELYISGYNFVTNITVSTSNTILHKTIHGGEVIPITLPWSLEMVGIGKFNKGVLIEADEEISLISYNYKPKSSDGTITYPIHQLGQLYYVVTPTGQGTPEFAIIAHEDLTRVTIYPKGTVAYKNKIYGPRSPLVTDLKAFEAIQLQSKQDLSGTRIESTKPVAVLSGNTCVTRFTRCDHVFEQLLPVQRWGTNFIVPPITFQTQYDLAYVVSAENTLLKYQFNSKEESRNLVAGAVFRIEVLPSQPLLISANAGIQVLFFFLGAKRGKDSYDPFLMNIPATTCYCNSYHIYGMKNFTNQAMIIAKSSESVRVKWGEQRMEGRTIRWTKIPGSEYSWAEQDVAIADHALSVEHESSPFGLFVFGVGDFEGYGTAALCSAASCPENSHYEACGNACPATCSDRSAPSTCKNTCVPICQCDEGFVRSSKKCVRVDSCNCVYQGVTYKAGEEFWGDEDCQSRCMCDAKLGQAVCRKSSCQGETKCSVVKGVRGCHDASYMTCQASGDPHYLTFDGKKYDFMGSCIYQMAGLCSKDPSLTPFLVTVENNHRGNKAVSYTKVVTVEIYDLVISMSQEFPQKIQVNGVFVEFPFSYQNKLSLTQSGSYGFIKTDFGLTVSFDWYSYVRVIVPNSYANALCGLCGNANQVQNDDFLMKDGTQTEDPTQFANSWKVKDIPGCSSGCTKNCPGCSDADKQTYQGPSYCGILTSKRGPFKRCHNAIDPQTYFDDCVYDTCVYKGHHDILCRAIGSYVTACQNQGISVEEWRSPSFCSVSCPPNTHYELCGSGCPATCKGLISPQRCDAPCLEGCVCDSGLIRNGDQCVPKAKCGCFNQGRYYKLGEEFFPTASCQHKCTCMDKGIINCKSFSCGAHEECKIVKGVQGCHPVGHGRIIVLGDTRLISFDGRRFELYGSCTYTLAQVCQHNSRLQNFTVWIEKEKLGNGPLVLIRNVKVFIHGYTIVLERGIQWQTMVDGEVYTLPMNGADGKFSITEEGNNIIISTTFGVTVLYDTSSYVEVSVPSSYMGHMCGLGGNFNGNPRDDFMLRNGKLTRHVEEFAASWKVPVNGIVCSDGCGNKCPVCNQAQKRKYEAENLCGMIPSKRGPFVDCHSWVNPAEYFENCLMEACTNRESLCRSLQAYVAACQASGAKIRAWRSSSFCPLTCPAHSHYEKCTRTCDSTCASLSAPSQCSGNCFEGCQCDEDYVFDGSQCVAMKQCGCTYDGAYLKIGEHIYSKDCAKRCTCQSAGELQCKETSCLVGEICAVQKGLRRCMKPDTELPCPENSHYEPCGNACPATCSDRSSPSTCKTTCAPLCQCDQGFVRSNGECVRVDSCNCVYQGVTYKAGEEFWGDEDCQSRCICDANLGQAVCQQSSCQGETKCSVVKGVRGCHAVSYLTCQASGDPHYLTFDGKKYDFMGSCIYQMAGLCSKDPSLTPFLVTVENNHRGNKAVSYTKVVTVEIYDLTISMSQEFPQRIQVNGVFVEFPFSYQNKLSLTQSGGYGFIKTDFDLTVSFDWYSYVRVIVPNSYANALCGLCGNANQVQNDDFLMKDGTQTEDPTQFANSWKVKDIPGCSSGCTKNCPGCSDADKRTYQGPSYCGILTSKRGPFKRCHNAIDPQTYFDDCVYDTCVYKGHHDILCRAIGSYVTACQNQGISVEEWRSPSFCSVSCPPNTHYELCGSGCPVTCKGLISPQRCDAPCLEGCVCDPGLIRNGDQCVPEAKCGCFNQGQYYKLGEEFFPTASCQQKCTCMDKGNIKCVTFSCGAHEECKIVKGVQGCHPVGHGRIIVLGDTSLISFDGMRFELYGSCTYTLAQVCQHNSRLQNFTVWIEKEKLGNGPLVLIRNVKVFIHSYTIVLQRGIQWQATVDGEVYTLPMNAADGKFSITEEGNNIIISTTFGVTVLYDTSSYVEVSVPSSYMGHMCGLGGNFNENPRDDFMLRNGKLTRHVEEFAASWKVPVNGIVCSDGCGNKCPVCNQAQKRKYEAENLCGMIPSKRGPFVDCHSWVNPAKYFDNCLMEACTNRESLCRSLQAYVAACQASGAKIRAWRSSSFCPLTCPAHSHYEKCTRTCDSTCASLSAPSQCSGNCFEGCQCDEDYVFDGSQCVAMKQCGCTYDGAYLKIGEHIYSKDCTKRCTCQSAGELQCKETSCLDGEICAIEKGLRRCLKLNTTSSCPENSHYEPCGNACPATCSDRSSPSTCKTTCAPLCQCDQGFVRSNRKCVRVDSCNCVYQGVTYKAGEEFWGDEDCQSRCICDANLGQVVCQQSSCQGETKCSVVKGVRGCHAVSYLTCQASGDPHYLTFDGKKYDFMGSCIYQMAGLCSKDPSLTPFLVTVENNHRGNKAVSYTKVVTVEIYNLVISMSQEFPQRIQVNGVFVEFPFSYQNKLSLTQSGSYGFIKTDFGLTVSFDWYSYVRVIVPNSYANALCGLCGNANQVQNDDFLMKDGTQTEDPTQFANSWKVKDIPGCSSGCTKNCPGCSDADKQTYQGPSYCGILTSKRGPFKRCHNAIDPQTYFDDCVYDTCVYKGHHDILCRAIGSYMTACQNQGISVEEWRSPSFCSVSCPPNTHYELCGSGCPATCKGLISPQRCDAPCLEGCVCDPGLIRNGDQCVPEAKCGCFNQGRYYKLGEEFFPTASCQQKCTCMDKGIIKCVTFSCGAHEECKIVKGVQGCHPVGHGRIIVLGDTRLISFDGRRFELYGSCTYTLAQVCQRNSRLQNFTVWIEKEKLGNGPLVLIRNVKVFIHGYTIVLQRGIQWQATVDGEVYTLPMNAADGKFSITEEGNNIIISTTFGVTVLYDTSSYVEVSVPSSYMGHMCGLGGNFNGNPRDDFMLRNGKLTQNVEEFAASWKVSVNGIVCSDGCGNKCPVCNQAQKRKYEAENLCGMIPSKRGPFVDCHSWVNPAEYFENCLMEACTNRESLCRSLQAYVAACQASGAKIRAWRSSSFCPLTCPAHSHYEPCTRTCDSTCASLSAPSQCSGNCFEGCQCDEDYVFDGSQCVAMKQCGCTYGGAYLKIGEHIYSKDCTKRCTCQSAGQLQCKETSCQVGETCALREGVRGCVRLESQCRLTAEARLTSFDGASGRYSSSGVYDIASICDQNSLHWFRLLASVKKENTNEILAGKIIYFYYRGGVIQIINRERFWVNGQKKTLPYENGPVSVKKIQDKIVIDHDFQVQIYLHPDGMVTIAAKETLRGKLCAACGNFNKNHLDDLKLISGVITNSFDEVLKSWVAEEFLYCF